MSTYHSRRNSSISEHSVRSEIQPENEVPPAHEKHVQVPGEHPMGMARSIGIIATCTLATLLNSANNTAVSITLPTLGRDLGIPEYRLQWAISAYALTSGALLLFFGRLADLYGRKICFLAGSICLSVFSLGCAFAKDEITIDVLRGFQGMGAAACIPAGLGILAHTFPPSRIRSVAFATFAAGAPVGAAIGGVISGILTQLTKQTWRSTFYFLTAIGFLCFIGGLLCFEKEPPSLETDRRVDWVGAFLITTGLVFVVFVLSDGPMAPDGWKTGYIIGLLIIGVIFLVLYVLWERFLEREQERGSEAWWTPPPLMKVSLWGRAKGMLAVTFVLAFLEYGSFIIFNFWITLYYQNYRELTPILTVIRLLPMSVTGVLCNAIVAVFVGRIPVVFLISFGTAMTATANLLYGVINPAAPYWAFGFPASIVAVFGADFVFAAGTLFVAKVCQPHEQSVGGAMFQTMTQLGAAFGLAITTIVYNSTLASASRKLGVIVNQDGTNAPKPAQLSAYKDALWSGFAFGMLGTVLAILFLRHAGIVGHQQGAESSTEDLETIAASQTGDDVDVVTDGEKELEETGTNPVKA